MKTKKSFLSYLLPYDANVKTFASLRTGLKEYQFLLKAFLEAVRCWRMGQFEKFDSLVGENACQIRAIWISLIASRDLVDIEMLNLHILKSLEKVEALLETKKIASLMAKGESLKAILEKEDIEFPLSESEILLVKAFLLSEMKVLKHTAKQMSSLCIIATTDPKKIKRFGEVSYNFADTLLSRLRRLVAFSSVQFVRDQAFAHQDKNLMRMVNTQFTQYHNTWPCIPMFWVYKTLLRTAQEQEVPLVLHVKFLKKNADGYEVIGEDCIFYKSENASYTAIPPDEQDLSKPAFVVQGIAIDVHCPKRWKEEINQRTIVDIILAGSAHHRQYPDQALDTLISELNDSEYENYKILAEKEGFSDVNPSRFFIQHVYASRAEHALEKISLRKKQLIAENLFSQRLPISKQFTPTPVPTAVSTSSRGA